MAGLLGHISNSDRDSYGNSVEYPSKDILALKNTIYKLEQVVRDAIEYVGSANYSYRETHALLEVRRNFALFLNGDFEKIKFIESD